MTTPDQLFTLEGDPPTGERPVLVVHLRGFVDAGRAGVLATDQLVTSLEHRIVARFDTDLLVDHRSRRPPMTFVTDRWEGYEAHELLLREVLDDAGTPFLLLTGPEPDVMWERFVAAVRSLVERYGVRLTVLLNAIPMAVPHTRPTGLTAHATRPELVAGHEPWLGRVQVPGTAAALLELRLGHAGHDAAGFAVHVPHYLAQTEHPEAAAALVRAVTGVSGLVLPAEGLDDAAQQTREQIDEQVSGSMEVAEVVRALEEQYDSVAGQRDRRPLLAPDEPLPSADELGAQFEQFLAGGDEPPRR